MTSDNLTKRKKEWLQSLGLVLCSCGISVGGLLKVYLGINNSQISIFITIISLFLLINTKTSLRYVRLPCRVLSILLYSLYTISLALFSNVGLWNTTVGIVYQITYLVQVILVWHLYRSFNEESFLYINFWFCGIATIFAMIIIVRYGDVYNLGIFLSKTETASAVSRATTSLIAFCGFTGALTYTAKRPYEKVCKIVFIICACTVLLISTRRNTLIASVLCLLIYFHNCNAQIPFNRKTIVKAFVALFIIFIVCVVLYSNNSSVKLIVDRGFQSVTRGISAYLGMDYDMAVAYRRSRIEIIPKEYMNNSTVLQFLFGRGYNDQQLDVPFLQAFWDMGILGGVWFFVIQGVVPLKHVLHRTSSKALLWAKFGTVLTLVQGFSNGTPYGKFLYIIAMYMIEMKDSA